MLLSNLVMSYLYLNYSYTIALILATADLEDFYKNHFAFLHSLHGMSRALVTKASQCIFTLINY